jgi:G3E family GTPase
MIPLHILTGFLGTGKTTLLARLLREPGGERIAVLVNEAGEIALDHHLMEAVDEDVLALPSGCVCCVVREDLYRALERVVALRPDRIVLETTGLADPAPILHGLASDPRLARAVRIAGVVAAADASRVVELLATQPEVPRQLELADRVALTKGDLAPARVAGALAALASAAPGCDVRAAPHGAVERAWLLAEEPLGRVRELADARAWLHHAPPGAAGAAGTAGAPGVAPYRTHSVATDAPARIELLELWLRLVTQIDGPRLLRIKALVECAESGEVHVLQSAQHAVSPPRRLARRPRGFGGAQVVVIERGLGEATTRALLASLRDALGARARAPRPRTG